MPLREDILSPISGDNPSGVYNKHDPVYAEIAEAAREEPQLPDESKRPPKVADWPRVSSLCQDALATKSKDLTFVAWLTQAIVQQEGFAGLRDGLCLAHALLGGFWEYLYPPLEGSDATLRVKPLMKIAGRSPIWVQQVPLTDNPRRYNYLQYCESRKLGYEVNLTDAQKVTRAAKIKDDSRIPPEVFDQCFAETSKEFYVKAFTHLESLSSQLQSLKHLCGEKFGPSAPNWAPLANAVQEVQRVVKAVLSQKRKDEPKPEAASGLELPPSDMPTGELAEHDGAPFVWKVDEFTGSEPPERRVWIQQLVELSARMRQQDPGSAGPYLMLRGLRFGELRTAAERAELRSLEAPPTEIRRQLKDLSLRGEWKCLLELAESAMALPCSRAWLDLQRMTVEACAHLGHAYNGIAVAIRSAVKSLLADVPHLRQAPLMDDTPSANAETQLWLDSLMSEPSDVPADPAEPSTLSPSQPGWARSFVDTSRAAAYWIRKGDKNKGAELMQAAIDAQHSGRGRFQRRLELVELLCGPAERPEIAQPLINDLNELIEIHKLETWEDRELVVRTLTVIYRYSAAFRDDRDRDLLFERICRLDPARAMALKVGGRE
jgi:type VI secretion system protein ImpA